MSSTGKAASGVRPPLARPAADNINMCNHFNGNVTSTSGANFAGARINSISGGFHFGATSPPTADVCATDAAASDDMPVSNFNVAKWSSFPQNKKFFISNKAVGLGGLQS